MSVEKDSLSSVSIIIPTLNEEKYLPLLLTSLKNVSLPLEIIVVDGASEDRTAEVVEEFIPSFTGPSSLTCIRSERGISLQRNLGAAHSHHEILMFCDADIIFPKGTFEKTVTTFVRKEYVVGSPIHTSAEKGISLYLLYAFAMFMQRVILLTGRPYFAGACLLTQRHIFEKLGGFDEKIALAEDVDYSIRAAKLGRYGLIPTKIRVSARRAIVYGYEWILSEMPTLFRLIAIGRVQSDTLYYPFGGYDGHKAHYVTQNRGKTS